MAGGRISRGWRLVKMSWEIVKSETSLLVLPIASFLCLAVVWGGLIAGAVGVGGLPKNENQIPPAYYVFIVIGYFLASCITIYFNAVVVGMATIRLRGGDPTMSDGFRLATSKIGKIVGWAALTATVGMILRAIEERAGFLGRTVIAIIGVAWAVVTFFVVPVLLYEQLGVFASVKRSASIFKERWGEQFIGNVTIGGIMFLLSLPVIAVCGLLIVVLPPLGIALMILAVGVMIGLGGALSGVFNAALYQYATTGQAVGTFALEDLQGSFRPKKGRL